MAFYRRNIVEIRLAVCIANLMGWMVGALILMLHLDSDDRA